MRTGTAAMMLFAAPLVSVGFFGAQAHADSIIPLSVQIGVGAQASESADRLVGSDSFHAGASLNLSNTSTLFVLPGTQGLDVDYNYASGHGGHFNAYGLTYTNRISLIPKPLQGVTDHVVPYVGFGVGAFEDEVKTRYSSDNKGTVGGKIVAGVGLPKSAFFEVSYIISGTAAGVRTDSINFAIGTHL